MLSTRDGRELGQIQHVPRHQSTSNQLFFGREVDQRYADLGLIRSWLPRCEQVHGISCKESGNSAGRLPYIRVIDTHERSVIDAPHTCRYVALSYVWGGRNVETR